MSLEKKVGASLFEVIDPELGINSMDLGLVYGIGIDVDDNVIIKMTLTTPGCPLHESIMNGVKHRVGQVEGVGEVTVNFVWDPPWTPAKISDRGKQKLGMG